MFVVLGNLYIRQMLYQLPTSRVCNFSIVFSCIIDSILQYDGKLFCKAFISALTGKLIFLSYKCSNSGFSVTAVFSSSLQSLLIKTFLCLPLGSKGVVPWTLPHSMKTVSIFLLYKLSRCTLSFSSWAQWLYFRKCTFTEFLPVFYFLHSFCSSSAMCLQL